MRCFSAYAIQLCHCNFSCYMYDAHYMNHSHQLYFMSITMQTKNADLQWKFCDERIYCKTVTDLQRNYNESLISKLQLTCNRLAMGICNGFISVAKHGGKFWRYSWRRHCNEFSRYKFAMERFRCKLATD